MKKIYLLFILLISLSTYAQKEKGLRTINKESAQAYINFLASDDLCGREAGTQYSRIASEYIKSLLLDMGIQPLFGDTYYQSFEAYSPDRQKKISYSVNTDSILKYRVLPVYRKLKMRNVLGYIEGKKKDEYVIVGAHLDHIGMDINLVDDRIYNGADDNASGVSAVLQIAKAFTQSKVKPERTIIFAFWDGEEIGLLGSEYFVQSFPKLSSIKGYLNFDMIGRNNDESKPTHVVYFYTKANPSFDKWMKDIVQKYKLNLNPDYRPWDKPIGGSDNSSFAKRDIPIIWYHTDGHSDYHQPGDHADKINWDKLVNITKAAYLNVWNLANVENY